MTAAHVLSPEYTVHVLMWFCDQQLWIKGYSCTHAFLLQGGPNTSSKFISICIIKIFPTLLASLLKIFLTRLRCLHRVWGRGGGDVWQLLTQQTDKQLNFEDIGRNSLLGKRKKIAKFLMRTLTYRSTFLYDVALCHNNSSLQPTIPPHLLKHRQNATSYIREKI